VLLLLSLVALGVPNLGFDPQSEWGARAETSGISAPRASAREQQRNVGADLVCEQVSGDGSCLAIALAGVTTLRIRRRSRRVAVASPPAVLRSLRAQPCEPRAPPAQG